jgi:hypothetical protein
MAGYFIFQVNPQKEHRLSDALEEMMRQGTKSLLLSPKPETNNPELRCGDVVYLWESASKRPIRCAHLAARGEVTQVADKNRDMLPWQQEFCIGGYSQMPRVEIEISKPRVFNTVDRNITDQNTAFARVAFLRNGTGAYQRTIIPLKPGEARALDVLACW